MSQQDVAAKADVKQSAISAFERQGLAAHVLSAAAIERLAGVLGVALPAGAVGGVSARPVSLALYFCPDSSCPSTVAYGLGEGRTAYRPRLVRADVGVPLYCPDCGEVCERTCPGCQAPVSELLRGAFCPECGTSYVSGGYLDEAAMARRDDLRRLLAEPAPISEFRHRPKGQAD